MADSSTRSAVTFVILGLLYVAGGSFYLRYLAGSTGLASGNYDSGLDSFDSFFWTAKLLMYGGVFFLILLFAVFKRIGRPVGEGVFLAVFGITVSAFVYCVYSFTGVFGLFW